MEIPAHRLLAKVRSYVQDPATQGEFSDDDIIECANEEQEGLTAKTIESSEDYFLTMVDVALQAGVQTYDLFDGFLLLRYLETLDPTKTQSTGNLIESRLIEGVQGVSTIVSTPDTTYFYALRDRFLDIDPSPPAGSGTLRGWYIQEPGPILFEGPSAPVPPTFPQADTIRLGSIEAPMEPGIMVGTKVLVSAGTGVGQVRLVTAYQLVATGGVVRPEIVVDTPFSPVLDATSVIGTISRLPRLFHTLLVYGAAIRLKIRAEESPAGLVSLYNDRREDFNDFVERARTYAQRSPALFDVDE